MDRPELSTRAVSLAAKSWSARLVYRCKSVQDTHHGLSVLRFSAAGLTRESSDAVIWRTCQAGGLVLVTGNRNADVPDSLELIVRGENRPDSLPVITLGNPQRILRDRLYAEKVAERLMAIDAFRGTGRLYVP